MTIEEIKNTLQMAIAEVEWEYPMEYAVAFEKAIEILEKQIERPPIGKRCPNCGQALK